MDAGPRSRRRTGRRAAAARRPGGPRRGGRTARLTPVASPACPLRSKRALRRSAAFRERAGVLGRTWDAPEREDSPPLPGESQLSSSDSRQLHFLTHDNKPCGVRWRAGEPAGRAVAGATTASAWNPLDAAVACWDRVLRVGTLCQTRRGGTAAIDAACRSRLRDLIEFTRARPQLLGPDTIAGARRGAERLSALLPRQLSHDAPDRLRLCLDPGEVADAAARRAAGEVARRALRAYLRSKVCLTSGSRRGAAAGGRRTERQAAPGDRHAVGITARGPPIRRRVRAAF